MKPKSGSEQDMSEDSLPGAEGSEPETRGSRLALRLYVTRGAANSQRALANLRQICEKYYASKVDLDIVDILQDPRRALADGILLTPTLVRLAPPPQVRIVGDLSQIDKVLSVLGAAGGE